MISVTQLRSGVHFLYKSQPHKVVEYKHTHMGRGGGTIRVKIKNLKTFAVTNEAFKSGDRVEEISVVKKQVQFAYRDAQDLVFMDEDTYEQLQVPSSMLEDKVNFLTEGMKVWLHIWEKEDQEVLDVELPAKVTVEILSAAPGEKGNSASNVYKDASIEGGFKIKVPLFVNTGDSIIISTEDGTYQAKA